MTLLFDCKVATQFMLVTENIHAGYRSKLSILEQERTPPPGRI